MLVEAPVFVFEIFYVRHSVNTPVGHYLVRIVPVYVDRILVAVLLYLLNQKIHCAPVRLASDDPVHLYRQILVRFVREIVESVVYR